MITPLIIEPQEEQAPQVILDPMSKRFSLSGDIILDEPLGEHQLFFKPIYEWFHRYSKTPNNETIFEFKIYFANPGAWEQIEKLINLIKNIPNHQILWLTDPDDEDMQEAGEELSEATNANFAFMYF